jgi:hypothetical protein
MRSPGHVIPEIGPTSFYRNFGGRSLRKLLFLPFRLESKDRLESSRFAEKNVNYGTFHVDHIRDLHIPTA